MSNSLPARFAQILYDDIFKLVFAAPENRDLLIMLLNLLIPGLDIAEITFLDKEQHGFAFNEKNCIFDVYCRTQRDERIVVEMQYSSESDFLDRTLFYATYPIREQLVTGFRDLLRNTARRLLKKKRIRPYRLKPVYVVSILNFSLQHDADTVLEDGLVSRYEIRERSSGEMMTDALHFVFLELGRMTYGSDRPERCQTVLEKLAFSLKYMRELRQCPDEMLEEIFKRLFDATELAAMDAVKRKQIDKLMTTKIDIIAGKINSYVDGMEVGLERGREEGWEEERKRIAKELREQGVSEKVIENVINRRPSL